MAKQPVRGERSQAVRAYLQESPTHSPKQVVAALKEKGIEVTEGLVSNIKYGKKSRLKGRKKRVKGVVKGEAIRAYLVENPGTPAKAVREDLAKKGVNVSEGLISLIKSKMKRGPKPAKRAPAPVAKSSGGLSAADLLEVKKMADQLGGLEKTRQAIELLQQLQ